MEKLLRSFSKKKKKNFKVWVFCPDFGISRLLYGFEGFMNVFLIFSHLSFSLSFLNFGFFLSSLIFFPNLMYFLSFSPRFSLFSLIPPTFFTEFIEFLKTSPKNLSDAKRTSCGTPFKIRRPNTYQNLQKTQSVLHSQ